MTKDRMMDRKKKGIHNLPGGEEEGVVGTRLSHTDPHGHLQKFREWGAICSSGRGPGTGRQHAKSFLHLFIQVFTQTPACACLRAAGANFVKADIIPTLKLLS